VSVPEEVVVAMDMSFELRMQGLWNDCKAVTAMVLESVHDFSGKVPIVVGYSETAQVLDPAALSELELDYVFGTNVQHALQVARYALDKKHGPKRVLSVSEVDPSAHCVTNGDVQFNFPPTEETRRITLNEARACAMAGIRIDILLLTPTSPFEELAKRIASECGGSVTFLSGPKPRRDEIHAFMSDVDMG
jgi:uncharacterized protein with von Willebrand factor type A (vWA) domain